MKSIKIPHRLRRQHQELPKRFDLCSSWDEVTVRRYLCIEQYLTASDPPFHTLASPSLYEGQLIERPQPSEPVMVLQEDTADQGILRGTNLLPDNLYTTDEGLVFEIKNQVAEFPPQSTTGLMTLQQKTALYSTLTLNQAKLLPGSFLQQKVVPYLSFVVNVPEPQSQSYLQLDDCVYRAEEDFEDECLGKYTLLEQMFLKPNQEGEDPPIHKIAGDRFDMLPLFLAIVYQEEGTENQLDHQQVNDREQLFWELPVTEAFAGVGWIIEGLDKLHKSYASLFKPATEHNKQQRIWQEHYQKYGWLQIARDLGFELHRKGIESEFFTRSIGDVLREMMRAQDEASARAEAQRIAQEEAERQAKAKKGR